MMLCACSPQAYVLNLENRHPSASGLDLDNKEIAILYLEDGSSRDSLFNNCFADGFAQALEKEYFDSKPTVEVFSSIKDSESDYLAKDSLVSLALAMDKDVIFVVDAPTFSESTTPGKLQCLTSVYAYDTMYQKDTVVVYSRKSNVSGPAVQESMFPSDALYLGMNAAKPFLNEWKAEQYPLIYIEGFGGLWTNALEYASQMKWDDAIDVWLQLADNRNAINQACAEYNIAVACHLQRKDDLALEWLDLADKTYKLSLSPSLRQKIKSCQ